MTQQVNEAAALSQMLTEALQREISLRCQVLALSRELEQASKTDAPRAAGRQPIGDAIHEDMLPHIPTSPD